MKYPKQMQRKVVEIIRDMEEHRENYVTSDTAFSRTKKLSFQDTMITTLMMQGGSLGKELYQLGKDISVSGYVQRRDQIRVGAYEYLFHEFTRNIKAESHGRNGYRILAVDGTKVTVPARSDTSFGIIPAKPKKNGEPGKTFSQVHVNGLYDVRNHIFLDAIVNDSNEMRAAKELVNRYHGKEKAVFIMDRGYNSYDLIYTFETSEKPVYYCIRLRNNGLYGVKYLPEDEVDKDITVRLSTSGTDVKNGYADTCVNGESRYGKKKKNVNWHHNVHKAVLHYRLIRVRLENGEYETFATNLPRNTWPAKFFRELYRDRWNIETAFKYLKYDAGMLMFHSKKDKPILQAIWAYLFSYNFTMACINLVYIRQKNAWKYVYKVNVKEAFCLVRMYVRQVEVHAPPDETSLLETIQKYIVPIRPGRKDERKVNAKGAIFFGYRLAA